MKDLSFHTHEGYGPAAPTFVIPASDDFFPKAIGAYLDHLRAMRRGADYDVQAMVDEKIGLLMSWREEACRWRDKYLDGKIAEREAAIAHDGKLNDEEQALRRQRADKYAAPLPEKPAVHPDRPVGDG